MNFCLVRNIGAAKAKRVILAGDCLTFPGLTQRGRCQDEGYESRGKGGPHVDNHFLISSRSKKLTYLRYGRAANRSPRPAGGAHED